MPAFTSPEIQGSFQLSYGLLAIALFVVPDLVGTLLEIPILLAADRLPRKWAVAGGLFGMSATAMLAAMSPTWWALSAFIAASAVAAGIGVDLAQATLMDAYPERREVMMARWTLCGSVGDLIAPIMVAALATAGLGWRGCLVCVGALAGLVAIIVLRCQFPDRETGGDDDDGNDDDDDIGAFAALRAALADRSLLAWLAADWLCELLDEILLVFAVLHLRDDLGASLAERSVAIGAFTVGAIAGLFATDRLLARYPARRLLEVAAASCALVYAGWLWAPDPLTATVFLAAVGVTASPLYPLVRAQAYRALPGRSAVVQAAGAVFSPLSIGLSFALGAIADAAGLGCALAVLALQPLGIFAVVRAKRGS